jgi:hypothetical protein
LRAAYGDLLRTAYGSYEQSLEHHLACRGKLLKPLTFVDMRIVTALYCNLFRTPNPAAAAAAVGVLVAAAAARLLPSCNSSPQCLSVQPMRFKPPEPQPERLLLPDKQ